MPKDHLAKSMVSRRSLAPSPPPDDREKLRDLRGFEQEGVGSVLRCSLAVNFPLENRQHDDLRPRQAGLDPLGRVEGIGAAEIDIHRTTSGSSWWATRTTSSPSAASPTTVRSGCLSRLRLRYLRNPCSGSAIRTPP